MLMVEAARKGYRQTAGPCDTERTAAIEVTEMAVTYTEPRADRLWGKRDLVAVQPLSLHVRPGETLAIVGESGSGKTSLARAILGLVPAKSGKICFFGRELFHRLEERSKADRRNLQLVFQDPVGSLNPAMRVQAIIAEPLQVHEPNLDREERDRRVARMLERVNLKSELLQRFPHELSGGQAQRVAIARALILKPAVLICDEAIASLDGSARQGILSVLAEEQRRSALSIIFISHDLDVVRQISHRVVVMYMGQVFEAADSSRLFSKPLHPYSRALIDCIPVPDPDVPPVEPPVIGEAPSMFNQPTGCVFHPRCRHAIERCESEVPQKKRIADAVVACHRAADLDMTIG
jgi:oligopeptide/dipeptide ABC transporter ATP-binding protein